jgi:hypothetical protein
MKRYVMIEQGGRSLPSCFKILEASIFTEDIICSIFAISIIPWNED